MTEAMSAAPASPSPFAGSEWFDPLEEAVRLQVRGFIEELLQEELEAALGRGRYERGEAAKGHRHGRRPRQLVLGLALTMFLAPCLEIQTFFLTAGTRGPAALVLLMAVYLVVTVAAMCALVALAHRGLHRLPLAGFARYERRLTGAVLVAVGLAGFFMDW